MEESHQDTSSEFLWIAMKKKKLMAIKSYFGLFINSFYTLRGCQVYHIFIGLHLRNYGTHPETDTAILTLCMLGNFSCFLSSAAFFQKKLFQKFFQEHYHTVKPFGYR